MRDKCGASWMRPQASLQQPKRKRSRAAGDQASAERSANARRVRQDRRRIKRSEAGSAFTRSASRRQGPGVRRAIKMPASLTRRPASEDLPFLPDAQRINIQIGPMEAAPMVALARAGGRDSMDSVAASTTSTEQRLGSYRENRVQFRVRLKKRRQDEGADGQARSGKGI